MTAGRRIIRMSNECQGVQQPHLRLATDVGAMVIGSDTVKAF